MKTCNIPLFAIVFIFYFQAQSICMAGCALALWCNQILISRLKYFTLEIYPFSNTTENRSVVLSVALMFFFGGGYAEVSLEWNAWVYRTIIYGPVRLRRLARDRFPS